MNHEPADLALRVFIATGVVVLVAATVLILWYVVDVLLLVFAGLLFAIFLRGLSDWLSAHTRLTRGWALAVVGVGLCGLLGAAGWLLATELAAQVAQLADRLPRAVQTLTQDLEARRWGRWLLDQVPRADALRREGTDLLAAADQFFFTPLGALINAIVILFVGLYAAVEPSLYIDGLVRLIPPARRARAREVMHAVRDTLQWWLLGKLLAMAIIGILTAGGLWLLGVPLALTFGLLAALLTFIPNFGPLLALIPPALLALTEDPWQALYVGALYLGIQAVESYLLTPLVQRQTVALPPALTLVAQVALGVLAGGLGLLVATPLTAAALVVVQRLYVEDTLEETHEGSPAPHDGKRGRRS